MPAADPSLETILRARLDGKAKPPGSLGRVEELALALGLIQGRTDPRAERAVMLVFAADHGLTRSGVSAYPASFTAAMVETLLAGRASANAFAKAAGATLRVVDAGVDAVFAARPGLVDAKIARGTRDAVHEAAMSEEELFCALDRGRALAQAAAGEFDVLALGEMGIGNSASAALILHRLGPVPLARSIGQGAGHSEASFARKIAALEKAAARSPVSEPREVLREFGGFEIAMMAGAILGAREVRLPVVVDGFIVGAAALAACRLDPAARAGLIFAHRSAEAGHQAMLEALDAHPLLDLGMRLGEGTGALLALPLLRAAALLLSDVAELSEVVPAGG